MKGSKITAYRINLINPDSSGQITKITFRNFLLLPVVSLEPTLMATTHHPVQYTGLTASQLCAMQEG
jgi:hypothetical protein